MLLTLVFFVTGCNSVAPPLEFAPPPDIVKKAIVLQIQQSYSNLSSQLKNKYPIPKIKQINVTKIEPLLIANFATYHLKGTYQIELNLPTHTVKQKQNEFDIYVQRQKQGKTWRLLRKSTSTNPDKWSSYHIPN
jgi:hypothetical protein